MRHYTVHLRAARPAEDPDLVLVRNGFCWPAFFLPVLWALYHGLWRALLAYLLVGGLLGYACAWFEVTALGQGLLAVGLAWLVGVEANDWRRAALDRAGYRDLGPVAARDLDEAETRVLLGHRFGRPAASGLMP
jgi:hypothetical protein